MRVSDLCASPYCADLALPGEDWCHDCLREMRLLRAEHAAEVARLTAEHEARVVEQDEAAA